MWVAQTDNTIICWGCQLMRAKAEAPEGSFQAVGVGFFHSCGLRTDGTITCWGVQPVRASQRDDRRARGFVPSYLRRFDPFLRVAYRWHHPLLGME